MIPGISGGLTNSGTMPIDAGGGASGDSTATSNSSFGGIKQGAINMGGGGFSSQLPLIVLAGVLLFLVVKK